MTANHSKSQNPAYDLIAMDVDGTLMDSSGQPSRGILEAIQAARGQGVTIVLVSGRGPQGVLPLMKRLDLEGPFIASGGALIANAPDRSLIDLRTIPLRWANALARLGHAEQAVVFFEHPDWLLSEADGQKMEAETRSFGYDVTYVKDLRCETPSAPCKITMVGDPPCLKRVIQSLTDRSLPLNYAQAMPRYLDCYRKDVSKGLALKRVARYLRIPMKRVMAIGDYYNDITMFEVAGLSVAMGNAPIEVRQAARLVAPGNDEGGAAWAIKMILLSRAG